jgi:hypothetical protein
MRHEALNPGIAWDGAELVARMLCGKGGHDTDGMRCQGLEGCPGQGHFPRLGRQAQGDQHPRRPRNIKVRRRLTGWFPYQRPDVVMMPRERRWWGIKQRSRRMEDQVGLADPLA